jgi:hypothetical protein
VLRNLLKTPPKPATPLGKRKKFNDDQKFNDNEISARRMG